MQTTSNKTSCCNFDEFRVTFDNICDFIPVVSTISMTIGALQKHLYVPEMEANDSLRVNHYYTHLKEKDFEQKWLLFVPGVNFVVAIIAYCSPDASKVKTESSESPIIITNEENEISSEEIIDNEDINNEDINNEDEENLNEIEDKKTADEKRAIEEQQAAERKADEEKREAALIKIAENQKANEEKSFIENPKTLELLYPAININDMIQMNPHIDNLIFRDILYNALIGESPHFNLSSLQIKRVIEAFNICNLNINKTDENLNYIFNTTQNSLFALFKIIPLLSPKNCDLLFKLISGLPPEYQSQNLINAADLFTYSYNDPTTSISLLHQIHELPTACKLFDQTNWHFLKIIEDIIIKFPAQKKNILNNIEKLYIWTDKVIQNAAKDLPSFALTDSRHARHLPGKVQIKVIENLAKCLQLRRDILNPSLSIIIENQKLNIQSRLNLLNTDYDKFIMIDSISQKCFLLISAFYNLSLIPVHVLDSSSESASYKEYNETEEYEDVEAQSELDSEDSNISSESSASSALNSSEKSLSSEEELLSSEIDKKNEKSSIATKQHNDFDIETFIAIIKESILPIFVEMMKKKLR